MAGNGFTKQDLSISTIEEARFAEEPKRDEELTPGERAAKAAKVIAKGLEDLPEVKKVVDIKSAPGRIWILLRIQSQEDQSKWAGGSACELLHYFKEKYEKVVEIVICKQLFPDKSQLGAKLVKHGWAVAVSATNWDPVVRGFSDCLSDYGPKLRVSESPLVGPGTPKGNLATHLDKGKKGAQPIGGNG